MKALFIVLGVLTCTLNTFAQDQTKPLFASADEMKLAITSIIAKQNIETQEIKVNNLVQKNTAQEIVDFLNQNPNIDLVGCDYSKPVEKRADKTTVCFKKKNGRGLEASRTKNNIGGTKQSDYRFGYSKDILETDSRTYSLGASANYHTYSDKERIAAKDTFASAALTLTVKRKKATSTSRHYQLDKQTARLLAAQQVKEKHLKVNTSR